MTAHVEYFSSTWWHFRNDAGNTLLQLLGRKFRLYIYTAIYHLRTFCRIINPEALTEILINLISYRDKQVILEVLGFIQVGPSDPYLQKDILYKIFCCGLRLEKFESKRQE